MINIIKRFDWVFIAIAIAGLGILAAIVFAVPTNDGGYPKPVNMCNDGLSVVYAPDGSIYGDQNHDGQLSGDDCKWR